MNGFETFGAAKLTPEEIRKQAEANKRKKIYEKENGNDALNSLQEALDSEGVTVEKLEETGAIKPRAVFKAKGDSATNPGEFDNAEDAIDALFERRN